MTATALLLLALAAPPSTPAKAPAKAAALETEREKTLYALGVAAADSFKVFNLKPAELAVVERGLSDAVLGKQLQVDMKVYRPKVNELAAASYSDNSRAALAHFAKEKGAITYPSGLIYIPSRVGTGPMPTAFDTVKVEYEGKLPDGTIFDSSRKQGGPVSAALAQSIPCWKEGLQKMKVGTMGRIVCPASLAYGDAGKSPNIPPKSTLIFDVELLSIESPSATKPPAAPADGKK
jgi:FKBP-type peptidyl-prolyl cis-trans isomerase